MASSSAFCTGQPSTFTRLIIHSAATTTGSFYVRAERERLGPQVERAAPAAVRLQPGQRTQITFVRTTDQTCATEVVFPQLEIRRPLPLEAPVVVDLPPQPSGELSFVCGMDMLRGVAVFSPG